MVRALNSLDNRAIVMKFTVRMPVHSKSQAIICQRMRHDAMILFEVVWLDHSFLRLSPHCSCHLTGLIVIGELTYLDLEGFERAALLELPKDPHPRPITAPIIVVQKRVTAEELASTVVDASLGYVAAVIVAELHDFLQDTFVASQVEGVEDSP